MGRNCAVKDCSNQSSKTYLFPNPKCDEALIRVWLKVCGNEELNNYSLEQVHKKFRVCSRHFFPELINAKNRLQRNAVPSLFLPATSTQTAALEHSYASSSISRVQSATAETSTAQMEFMDQLDLLPSTSTAHKSLASTSPADQPLLSLSTKDPPLPSISNTDQPLPSTSTADPTLLSTSNDATPTRNITKRKVNLLQEIVLIKSSELTPKARFIYKKYKSLEKRHTYLVRTNRKNTNLKKKQLISKLYNELDEVRARFVESQLENIKKRQKDGATASKIKCWAFFFL